MISLLFLLFISAHAQDVCTVNANNCSIYECAAKNLNCSEDNYLYKFGGHYCEVFLTKASEGRFSQATMAVLEYIRPCLQEELIHTKDLTCENVESIASQHHVACYLESGFCQLSFPDKLSILNQVWKETFRPAFRTAMKQIMAGCRAQD